MNFDKDYLIDLVNGKTQGDFPPYSTGDWEKTDAYLKQVVGRLKDIRSIEIKADFDHYGSGFSSYVPLYLSKKDKSDVVLSQDGDVRTEETHGLMIYLCRMAPFYIYASGTWYETFYQGQRQSRGIHYIEPQHIGTQPKTDWENEWVAIQTILNEYGMGLLTKEELDTSLDFEIAIPTIFSTPPYKVFDCFFYWED